MDKQDKKRALRQWQNVEHDKLLEGMPLSAQQLDRLLDHLDQNLDSCDQTTRLTQRFLEAQSLEAEVVLAWLREQGGFCDCEVLANVDDFNELLKAPEPAPRIAPRQKEVRAPRNIESVGGWNVSNLPKPWRIANLYAPAEPLRLELGKKGGCSVTIVEGPLPIGDQASDEFWSRLWYARTELPVKGELHVSRGILELPAGYQATLVRASGWTPVYCWIFRNTQAGYLEVITESNRYAGDLPQIAALVACLAKSPA